MKNVIITSAKTSSWVSCQVISPNLVKAYEHCFPQSEYVIFDYNSRQSRYESIELARAIHKHKPQKIIFVDHSPHPLKLMQILDFLYENEEKPELYFHVFGDFTLFVKEWFELEPILKNFKVAFLAASHRQQALVQSFCHDFSEQVHYFPFPVDEKQYYFSEKIRTDARKNFGIKPEERIFTYTGRLSEQKNILGMVKGFYRFLETTSSDSRLYLAGDFDDLGIPFIGITRPRGFYYQLWQQELAQIPKKYLERIVYLGNLKSRELLELNNASDCYLSLSTHNDEDFGMSPAESFCCGTRGILSDWAGYASFADEAQFVRLLPVTFDKNRINVAYTQLIGMLFKTSTFEHSSKERNEIAEHFQKRLGVCSLGEELKRLHKKELKPFTSFSRQFRLLDMAFSTSQNAPFRLQTASHNQLYGNIYAPYFRTT